MASATATSVTEELYRAGGFFAFDGTYGAARTVSSQMQIIGVELKCLSRRRDWFLISLGSYL